MISAVFTPITKMTQPPHGGRVTEMQARFPEVIPPWSNQHWLDLSTGIAPRSYPFTLPDPDIYLALPDQADRERCLIAARKAYQVNPAADIQAGNGSQQFIQALPQIARKHTSHQSVCIISPTYAEHAYYWCEAGFMVYRAPPAALEQAAQQMDVVILVNPNNPTGHQISPSLLQHCQQILAQKSGWLIIDEAFADVTPDISLCPYAGSESLFILRSLGKFYGLAGLRLGFLISAPHWHRMIQSEIGPWPVATPALQIGAEALSDSIWQTAQQAYLQQAQHAMTKLILECGLTSLGSTALFHLIEVPDPDGFSYFLCQNGILARFFSNHPTHIRLGLVPEKEWSLFQHLMLGHIKSQSGLIFQPN